MKLRHIVIIALASLIAGCAGQPKPQTDAMWLLLASPASSEYPDGTVAGSSFARWPKITEYAYLNDCGASLREVQNEIQRPVACVASDDPRLKQN